MRTICATLAALAGAAVGATSVGAQEPANAPGDVVAPATVVDSAVAPFERPDGALLRTGVASYRLTLLRDAGPTALGTRTVEVSESSLGGAAVWLIAERRTGTVVPTADSLWLTRADLSPVRWVGTVDRTQMAASFSRDSIFGAVQSYAGRHSFASGVLAGVLVTPGMVERIVEQLPLRLGYRAGASLLVVDMGTARALPAEIAVEGEERVRGATGDVDSWLVVLRAGAMQQRLWVDKGRRVVVKTEQGSAQGTVVAELL